MATSYAYNTPPYFDFEEQSFDNEDTKKVEAYFDFDHENLSGDYFDCRERKCSAPKDDYNRHDGLRRSLSMSSLPQGPKPTSQKENQRREGSTTSLHRKSYYSSKEILPSSKKHVTMAESIRNFQNRTPDRFHSRPKGAQLNPKKSKGPISATIPRSPDFATKKRCRSGTVMSYEERELQEFKEAQKHRHKANPVNMNILQGPFKPKVHIVKKPSTLCVPFKITEVQKAKPSSPKKDLHEFRAKPIPKSVYEPKVLLKNPILSTQPLTPSFVRKFSEKMKQAQVNLQKEKEEENRKLENKNKKLSTTRPEPFSFDQRNQYLVKKKEEFVKQVIEEEKKKREFVARPAPKNLYTSGSMESLRSTKSDDNASAGGSTVFKARPARVLSMEPFVPKKDERPVIEVTEFQLNTDRRARERDDFERKLREKQECDEEARKRREEINRLKEEEERALLRKQMEHVTKPIRRYKKLPQIAPKPLTEPCSPNLYKPRPRDKENICDTANL